ncbi:MAG: dihydrodipicolinate synthase family protein [Clostridia bacterium]|nr:dihydrodipicolinate synthase family protein [Clostridia bacterium]MBP3559639.1 dihydrodipicolinate synthase family protein [Clostridia bacterium]
MAKLTRETKDGIYSLMLTPFFEDRSIDYNTYEKYADWQVEQGVDHLFAVCGSSEMKELTLEERLKLAELTVKHKGETTVVATANIEPTKEGNLEEIKKMEQTGVDGLVLTTKGMGDDDDKLVEYIRELAQSTTLPVFLYEFPGFQPHLMSGKAYGELTKDGLIWGIKDTTCSLELIKDKIANKGDSTIIQANMPYLFDSYVAGARGVMATPTSCGGAFFQRFHEAFLSGDMALAEQRYNEIILLDNAIDSGFCASAKELIRLQGVDTFNWYTRGSHHLSPARLRSIKSFHDWCVANGLMK